MPIVLVLEAVINELFLLTQATAGNIKVTKGFTRIFCGLEL